jgi:hypothetical protein
MQWPSPHLSWFSQILVKPDARLFSVTLVALTSILLIAIAVTNYLVNPLNYYQTCLFEPLVQTAREEKVARLQELTTAPSGLVLGSSRVLKFEPDYLNERTGLDFYRQQFSVWPKIILIGVDEYAFSTGEPIDPDLICNQQLSSKIPEFITLENRLLPWQSLIAWQQTSLSIKSIAQQLVQGEAQEKLESLCPDGKIVYHQREQKIADGTYDFQSALEYNLQEYRSILSRYHGLSQPRVAILRDTLRECSEAGCEVSFFYTPLHARLRQELEADPKYELRMSELQTTISELASQINAQVFDFSQVESFSGDPNCFVDGIHPLEYNTRMMVDAILNARLRSINLAIQ